MLWRRKLKSPPPDLEEAIAFGDEETVELSLSASAFRFLAAITLLAAAVAAGRSLYLVSIKGEFYTNRAAANANEVRIVEAKRGIIFDRFGQPLAENVPGFNIRLRAPQFIKAPAEERNAIIAALAENRIISEENLLSLLDESDIERDPDVLLARNITPEQAARLKAVNPSILLISEDYTRHYKDGFVFSSVLGYVGIVSRDDIASNPSLFFNDIIGKNGLEFQYDEVLRGKNGKFIVYRNAAGDPLEEQMVSEPKSGSNLQTTIDADFQKYFYQRFGQGLAVLGRTSGVGIAMDPRNGEIISLLSFPSYDANIFSHTDKKGEREKILKDRFRPLFNRAVSGVYNPGSTVKPLVALAALAEKVVTPETNIFSAGYIEVPNPYDPSKPSRFLDWKPHGRVNLYSAIARSSNVYFYALGGGFEDIKGLGIAKLEEWWRRFGFGKKTGIDFPGEAAGFIPNPENKESRTGDIWRIGDTYNVSIGQGDLLVTPLQLINYIAAIANGGILFEPHLIQNGNNPRVLARFDLGDALAEVRKGMEDAVDQPYGTAHLLSDLPVDVAAKTGTAQTNNNTKNNAWFVGYAPADNPQIAVLILIEDAPEGTLSAVPIAKDVLRWYDENRLK